MSNSTLRGGVRCGGARWESPSKTKRAAIIVAVKRRRMMLGFAATVAADAAKRRRSRLGPQGKNQELESESAFSWKAHCGRLTSAEFKMRYRIDELSFDELLGKIRDEIDVKDESQAANSRSSVGKILPEARLALTLRYLAGASHLDLKLCYAPISEASVYKSIWDCVDAINRAFPVEFPIDDEAKLREIARGFQDKSRKGCWERCVGAVDGVLFSQVNPGKAVQNPQRYFVGRKQGYKLLCQAVCDVYRRVLFFDMR